MRCWLAGPVSVCIEDLGPSSKAVSPEDAKLERVSVIVSIILYPGEQLQD